MNGCELLKCKYYNNGKCTSPHDTCIHQTPDALDGQTALEERDTLIVELQAEIAKLKKAYKKYAWHKKDCMLFSIAEHPHCTCGFEQALKGESDAI